MVLGPDCLVVEGGRGHCCVAVLEESHPDLHYPPISQQQGVLF